ncbi:MAG TPA: tetratricopeptide repeat protein [Termitinemataceae bacterium]|nr:tetratricopeptide repeat protein [Termitinemataceae bacterium]HOM22832.1 tetratricopeptide repeat protein [Termitinemataceae bacterium]HPP99773.1 tetratricopeptide repeat protein [Termitinemataceae bacterium]
MRCGRFLWYLGMAGSLVLASSCSSWVRASWEVVRGVYHMERNHPSEALGAFQLSLTDRDVYPYGMYNLATLALSLGEYEQAELRYSRLLEELQIQEPEAVPQKNRELLFRIWYNRGYVRYVLENYEGALSDFRSALILKPSEGTAKRNLELALKALEQKKAHTGTIHSMGMGRKKDAGTVLFEYLRQREGTLWKSPRGEDTEPVPLDY